MESVDQVHGIHGHCPAGVLERKHWTISSEFMENVHGVFPVCPWNFSSMSMELFHGIHGVFSRNLWTFSTVHGDCPGNQWTKSMDIVHGKVPWTMSMEKFHGQCPWKSSMDNVHGICRGTLWTKSMDNVHGIFPWTLSTDSRWLCSVNPEKTFESYCFHAHYGKMHLWLTLPVSLVDSCY